MRLLTIPDGKEVDTMRKRILAVIVSLCLAVTLSGCGHELAGYRPIEDVNNLDGRKVGVTLAWAADYVLSPRDGKDLILYRYDVTADMLMALFYHQIDAICVDKLQWQIMEKTNGAALHLIEEPVAADGFVAYMSPPHEALRDEFNQFLTYYHQTEEFADLYSRIQSFDGTNYEPGKTPHSNGNGEKIKLAFAADYFPYCYTETDGTIRGYDLEIIRAFADYSNYDIEFVETSETDVYYGVKVGNYDMAIAMISKSYAAEAEFLGIHASDIYYDMPLYLVELKEGATLKMDDDYYVA